MQSHVGWRFSEITMFRTAKGEALGKCSYRTIASAFPPQRGARICGNGSPNGLTPRLIRRLPFSLLVGDVPQRVSLQILKHHGGPPTTPPPPSPKLRPPAPFPAQREKNNLFARIFSGASLFSNRNRNGQALTHVLDRPDRGIPDEASV
jgi:hypothetical protein